MMKDEDKTKEQLINELEELRQRLVESDGIKTKLEQAEEALNIAKASYQSCVQQAPIGIVTTDTSGQVTGANPAALATLGSPGEDASKKVNVLTLPALQRVGANQLYQSVLTEKIAQSKELAYTSHWGKASFLRIQIVPILDEGGELNGTLTLIEDITERKRAEEDLRHSEEKYRSLIEHSNDAIYLLYENKFEVINKRFEEMFGVTQEEVRSPDFNFMQLVAPKSRELVKERVRMVARGQEPTHRYEFTALTKYGKEVEVEVSVSYVSYRGSKATQGILRDITHRKQLEAQLRQAQKMEAIGTLAGGIAHDFNNILTGISGYTQLSLAKLSPQHPLFTDLKKVEEAASRAGTLTRQILAFSRKQILEKQTVNMNQIIKDVMNFLRRILGEHIELNTVMSQDIPDIKADPTALEQVLTNLCVNARDAMPDGGKLLIQSEKVTLDEKYLENHPWVTQGEFVMMKVSDTGFGMDQETQSRIFEPFFTTKEAGEGTGLGLAIVYGLVKQHNGFIDLHSELDKGTTFKIYFPVCDVGEEESQEQIEEESISGGNETLLIAEDEDSVRNLMVELLESYGYTVISVANGAEALQAFQENAHKIDLAIFDAVMPQMGGREVYEIIKDQHQKVKFLFISGYNVAQLQKKFVIEKDMQLLKKPFNPSQLLTKVRGILDGD